MSGRSGFSCWPKQKLNTFTIGGFFRPGGWEALLAKKKRGSGEPRPFLSLPSERMGSGAFVSSFCRPLPPSLLLFPPKAEKGHSRGRGGGWAALAMTRPLCPTSCPGRATGLSLARLIQLTWWSVQLLLELLTSKTGQSLGRLASHHHGSQHIWPSKPSSQHWGIRAGFLKAGSERKQIVRFKKCPV